VRDGVAHTADKNYFFFGGMLSFFFGGMVFCWSFFLSMIDHS
jgi:hypothetical protein